MQPSIKETLHKIIDEASEPMLLEMMDWIENGMPGKQQYSAGEINLFYQRLDEHEADNSRSYTLEEAHHFIRNQKTGDGV